MVKKNKCIQKAPIAALTAVFLFAAATFQIAGENTLLGMVFFASASCFSSLAGIYRKREADEGIGDISK